MPDPKEPTPADLKRKAKAKTLNEILGGLGLNRSMSMADVMKDQLQPFSSLADLMKDNPAFQSMWENFVQPAEKIEEVSEQDREQQRIAAERIAAPAVEQQRIAAAPLEMPAGGSPSKRRAGHRRLRNKKLSDLRKKVTALFSTDLDLSHIEICKRLDKDRVRTPTRCGWSHLKWYEAIMDKDYKDNVKKWFSNRKNW